jgi:hypothetical protein
MRALGGGCEQIRGADGMKVASIDLTGRRVGDDPEARTVQEFGERRVGDLRCVNRESRQRHAMHRLRITIAQIRPHRIGAGLDLDHAGLSLGRQRR